MSDPYLHSDPAYIRAIAPRDQLAAYLYVRSLRNAYVRAHASALSRFVWRQIRQRFRAFPSPRTGQRAEGGPEMTHGNPATRRATRGTKPA